jgi:hypothetical protein
VISVAVATKVQGVAEIVEIEARALRPVAHRELMGRSVVALAKIGRVEVDSGGVDHIAAGRRRGEAIDVTAEVRGIVEIERAAKVREGDRSDSEFADLKRRARCDRRRLRRDDNAAMAVAGEIQQVAEVVEAEARAVHAVGQGKLQGRAIIGFGNPQRGEVDSDNIDAVTTSEILDVTIEQSRIVDQQAAGRPSEVGRADGEIADLQQSAGRDARRLIGHHGAALAIAGEIEKVVEVVEGELAPCVPSVTVSTPLEKLAAKFGAPKSSPARSMKSPFGDGAEKPTT